MFWNAKNGCVKMDDNDMDYVSFGHGNKAIVILPGLSDGLLTVKGKALLLAKPYVEFFEEFTVYMFSRKNRMQEGYSIREMAADQITALQHLGITKADVVGVSEGGMIAQFMASDYPDLVDKLIIAVSAPRVNEMIQSTVGTWIAMAEAEEHKMLMIDTAEKGYSENYLKKYRRFYPMLGLIGKPHDYKRFLVNAKAILGFNAYGELDRIVCPTYIIGGDEDKTVGVQGSYEMNERIKQSEIHIYQGLGHAAYEEAKDFYHRIYNYLVQ